MTTLPHDSATALAEGDAILRRLLADAEPPEHDPGADWAQRASARNARELAEQAAHAKTSSFGPSGAQTCLSQLSLRLQIAVETEGSPAPVGPVCPPCPDRPAAGDGLLGQLRGELHHQPSEGDAAPSRESSSGIRPPGLPGSRAANDRARDRDGLGRFSRARRRDLWARLRHRQPLILHPQRIYQGMRELRARPGGEEALGRFERLLEARGWHPTDQCALRRFAALMFGLDVAKPYNWGPRSKRSRRGMAKLADTTGAGTWGWSMRGIGHQFLRWLFAAGDGEPVDRSTIGEIYKDLKSVGLCSFHQPPKDAKLAPFERGPSGRAFSQYWFAMVGSLRKPSMRGELDHVLDWASEIDAWLARLRLGPEPPF